MALTADHLIVIGRGQLLADMSVKDFIARHSTGYALVRTPEDDQREALSKALTAAGGTVRPEQDGALRVSGLELPKISDVAHEADVRLWELSPHQASLEEAYMRLTGGAVDYRSTQDPRQGLQAPPPQGYGTGPGPGYGPGWGQPQPGWGQPQQAAPQPQFTPPPPAYGPPPLPPQAPVPAHAPAPAATQSQDAR
jgi:ABC-2 type transport system ATP-binding protein